MSGQHCEYQINVWVEDRHAHVPCEARRAELGNTKGSAWIFTALDQPSIIVYPSTWCTMVAQTTMAEKRSYCGCQGVGVTQCSAAHLQVNKGQYLSVAQGRLGVLGVAAPPETHEPAVAFASLFLVRTRPHDLHKGVKKVLMGE